MTFSLLARDPVTRQLGVAAQSHYFGVGSVVTWAEAGMGVVATQAFAERSYGPRGLALMGQGHTAADALSRLVGVDDGQDLRQVAFLDATGDIGVHSGPRCIGAVGIAHHKDAIALGNMLDHSGVADAVLHGYATAAGDLAHRLIAGLHAGDRSGGDIRGRQSAALLVVDGDPGDAPWSGVIRDLRVEDHTDPIGELSRLADLNDTYDSVSPIVFAPDGPVLGDRGDDRAEEFADAAGTLADAARALTPNPEAAFWCAVLRARQGQTCEAKHMLAEATEHNPRLTRFAARLAEIGCLTDAEVTELTCPQ